MYWTDSYLEAEKLRLENSLLLSVCRVSLEGKIICRAAFSPALLMMYTLEGRNSFGARASRGNLDIGRLPSRDRAGPTNCPIPYRPMDDPKVEVGKVPKVGIRFAFFLSYLTTNEVEQTGRDCYGTLQEMPLLSQSCFVTCSCSQAFPKKAYIPR